MQVLNFGEQLNTPIVICLGYFGCMHKGHRELVKTAKTFAVNNACKVALFTFSNNHLKVLGKDIPQLYTFDERLCLYESLGIDFVISAKFDEDFKNTTANNFLNTLTKYNLKGIVCGFDYTCGCDRQTSVSISQHLPNIPIMVVQPILEGNNKVSSTLVRQLLDDGEIASANNLLSQCFSLNGIVVKGRGVGKTMGFPTANIQTDADKFLPAGVFCGLVRIGSADYKCIINIGAKPTFSISEHSVEVHIINYAGDLYGQNLTIKLTKFLRKIIRFDSEKQLINQLQLDKEACTND